MVCRCFPTKKILQKNFFWILAFFGRFLTKKQPNLTKNEENWQNPNRLKFSEIWYVDVSQQNKMLQKNFFWISAFFGRFLTKKTAKIDQKLRKFAKPKPFGEIF